jgi:hypothetical protein
MTLGEQVDVLHEQYKDVFVVGNNEKLQNTNGTYFIANLKK